MDAAGVEPAMPDGRRIYSPLGLPIFLHIQALIITLLYIIVNLKIANLKECVLKSTVCDITVPASSMLFNTL